jgi:hypothetical protein
MAQHYQKRQQYQNQPNVLAVILGGLFKGLWWLVTLPFRQKKRVSGLNLQVRNHIFSKTSEINSMVRSENVYELKQAVIEADKLVDYILRAKGYQGVTFADRLKAATPYIEKHFLDAMWQGHKVRNLIAHESANIDKDSLRQAAKMLLEYAND